MLVGTSLEDLPGPHRSIIVLRLFRVLAVLIRLRQLGFPQIICFFGINIRKDEIEDIGIPAGSMTFDAVFDILNVTSVSYKQKMGKDALLIYLW